jgi:cytoskeletal protein RodZ
MFLALEGWPAENRRNRRYPGAMPETRGERTVFAIGALAIAALVALIVLQTATDRFEARGTSVDAAPLTRGTTAEVTASTQPAESTAPQTTSAPDATKSATETAGASRTARLTLTAIADTWVEVRSGSADGEVLYSGVLPQGAKERFRRAHLWASFGAAANLTAQLNGRPLKLRPGTYTALVGARGLKPL